MRRSTVACLAIWALSPSEARAQTIVGYQLGVTQSAGATFGQNQELLLVQAQDDPGDGNVRPGVGGADQVGADVRQLQGVQLNTTVTGNLTIDMVTNTVSHGIILGAAATQLFPLAVPEELRGTALEERLTAFNANATYLARIQQPRWSLQFGGGYLFSLNGRLDNSANGTVQNGGVGPATLPAARSGAFAFNGLAHSVNALVQLQLTRTRWDLTGGLNYSYTRNGVYTLAAGALGAQGAAGAAGTNLGAFIPANVHTFSPTLTYRAQLGRSGLLTAEVNTTYSRAEQSLDEITVTGTVTTVVRAPVPPPETLLNTVRAEYAHNLNQERSVGAELLATLSFRAATDGQGIPLPGTGLGSDALITQGRVFYRDFFRATELRLQVSAGAAQAHLFQPPFGAQVEQARFEPIRSNWLPVADLTLQRRFEPVDVTLTAGHTVGVGALGASAIVADAAALTLQYVLEIGDRRFTASLGGNANRTEGVGRELFQVADPNAPALVAFNNYGFGGNAGLVLPIYDDPSLSFDATATYNVNWVNTDPDDVTGVPPILTHVALLTIRGIYGRGTAQVAAGAGGRNDTDELDAFSANPATGAPLVTERLLRQGAPMLEQGRRPGQAPEGRRDSRQSFQQSIRQQEIEREARERSDQVQGIGSYQDEERRALEQAKEEQKRREEERTRELGEWPMDAIELPTQPAADEAPPPPS